MKILRATGGIGLVLVIAGAVIWIGNAIYWRLMSGTEYVGFARVAWPFFIVWPGAVMMFIGIFDLPHDRRHNTDDDMGRE